MARKTRWLLSCLTLLLAAMLMVTGCETTQEDKDGDAGKFNAGNDAEILGYIQTMNQHEIQVARAVLNKHAGAAVNDYAHMLEQDHTAAKQDFAKLAKRLNLTPRSTSRVVQYQKRGDKQLENIKARSGSDFTHAFASAMVNYHTEAVGMIDAYIADANHDDLVELLKSFRRTAIDHLREAKALAHRLDR